MALKGRWRSLIRKILMGETQIYHLKCHKIEAICIVAVVQLRKMLTSLMWTSRLKIKECIVKSLLRLMVILGSFLQWKRTWIYVTHHHICQ